MNIGMIKNYLIDWNKELQKINMLTACPSRENLYRLLYIADSLPTYLILEKDFLTVELDSCSIDEKKEHYTAKIIQSYLSNFDHHVEYLEKLNILQSTKRFLEERLIYIQEIYNVLMETLTKFQEPYFSSGLPLGNHYNPFLSQLEFYLHKIRQKVLKAEFNDAKIFLKTAQLFYKNKEEQWQSSESQLQQSIKLLETEICKNDKIIEDLQNKETNSEIFYMQLTAEHYKRKSLKNWLSLNQNILSQLEQYKSSLVTLNELLRKPKFQKIQQKPLYSLYQLAW